MYSLHKTNKQHRCWSFLCTGSAAFAIGWALNRLRWPALWAFQDTYDLSTGQHEQKSARCVDSKCQIGPLDTGHLLLFWLGPKEEWQFSTFKWFVDYEAICTFHFFLVFHWSMAITEVIIYARQAKTWQTPMQIPSCRGKCNDQSKYSQRLCGW